ncbi:MAG: hypothetical protein U5L98_18245 [Halomonas sp.]|uniref:hypothetical protein n=1 Tax=Halomonas sp. TaxID=1486246 RepID=UPI002ACDC533|nr:hypothetical protein [Halomonas sp.]MDZ7854516.1 hypothetical protein [Halomonas sp.]
MRDLSGHRLVLDIDGLPIEDYGHQGGSAFHGLYGARVTSSLVASLAEAGAPEFDS